VEFCDLIGPGEELGHGGPGQGSIILIEPCQNHPQSATGQFLHHFYEALAEELSLINPYDFMVGLEVLENVRRMSDGLAGKKALVVAGDGLGMITIVEGWLDRQYRFPGINATTQPTNELFGFATEHRATDDLDPALCPNHGFFCGHIIMGGKKVGLEVQVTMEDKIRSS
jgi:hypothetical protein